jgi:hypothetical protein
MGLEYRSHPLSEKFQLTTVFPGARSVQTAADVPPGVQVTEIVFTAPQSWAEADPAARPVKLDERDRKGPVCVLVAATGPATGGGGPSSGAEAGADTAEGGERERAMRLVVAGDSDFCANGFSSFGGNLDLGLNAVSWLSQEEDLIAIRPKSREDRRVHITQTQAAAVRSILLLGMPLAVLAIGVAVWWRRR